MVFTPTAYLLFAILLGYLLGSIPVAVLVSRRQGVDIFSAGTGLAGAANVSRTVGRWHGFAVAMIDAAKGMLAVTVAHRLGIQGDLVLLPAMAALAGHWRSIFTRFRGGDGLAILVGITIAVFPVYSILVVLTGGIVSVIARGMSHHPTLWGGTAGYSVLLVQSPPSGENAVVVLGIVTLALLVLIHGVVGHRRRGSTASA